MLTDSLANALMKNIPEDIDIDKVDRLELVSDLTEPKLYVAKLQVIALSREIKIAEVYEYRCTKCGYRVYGVQSKSESKGTCPKCRQGELKRDQTPIPVVYRVGKVMIDFEDAKNTVLPAIFTQPVMNIRGGSYTCLVTPVLVKKKSELTAALVIHRLVEKKTEKGSPDLVWNILKDHDPITRLNLLAKMFVPDLVYGLEPEKLLLLCVLVGGYGGPFVKEHRRWWLHACMVGDPETAKSTLVEAIREAVPNNKCILLQGSKLTIPGISVGSAPGGVVYEGPLLLLDGDYEDFGVLILEEAHRLSSEFWHELKDAMERGECRRALATTGYIGGRARTSIIVTGNWATSTSTSKSSNKGDEGSRGWLPSILPPFLRDAAMLRRFDVLIFTFQYEDEVADQIVLHHLTQFRTAVTLDDIREYIAECRKIVPEIKMCKRTEELIREMRRDLAAAYSSYFRVELSGISATLSVLRIAIALAKLARLDVVEPGLIEFAYRDLVMKQLEKLETLRSTAKLRAGLTTILNTIVAILLEKGSMKKTELFEEVKKRLEKEYEVNDMDIEKAIEALKQRGTIYEPELGVVELVRS